MPHAEHHHVHRSPWLRAAVLGANDGIVSTAALVLGVAGAQGSTLAIATAGFAGLIGGALSMAAGEYVSVASQRDVEQADLALEQEALTTMPGEELDELTQAYVQRGLSTDLARQVAEALTAHDALEAHARVELGLDPEELARPVQAAVVSAVSFALGAALPLGAILASPLGMRLGLTLAVALATLASLGALSARLGGAPVGRAVLRVVLGGTAAIGLTWVLGTLFGAAV